MGASKSRERKEASSDNARTSETSESRKSKNTPQQVKATEPEEKGEKANRSVWASILVLVIFFALCSVAMTVIYLSFPELPPGISRRLTDRFGDKNIFAVVSGMSAEDMRVVHAALNVYTTDYQYSVLALFMSSYVFLQTFAIPGPIILSVLAGALFGFWWGLLIVQACATTGACLCYWMFRLVGRPVVLKFWKPLMDEFKAKLDKQRQHMFWYILFLRITPILPNWFINISTGNLSVPFGTFFLGTLLGLIPNNVLMCQTGVELRNLEEFRKVDPGNLLLLLGLGFVALLPTLFSSKLENCLDRQKGTREGSVEEGEKLLLDGDKNHEQE